MVWRQFLGPFAGCGRFFRVFGVVSGMDSIFSIGAFVLIIGLIVLVIIVQQFQQNRQYAEIQARLREIRDAELREQKANALRAERTALMDPVTMLEATIQSRTEKTLTEEELYQIEVARTRIKSITDELMHNQQWLGLPYDLEWHELIERIPLVKGAFLAANFNSSQPELPTSETLTTTATPTTPAS